MLFVIYFFLVNTTSESTALVMIVLQKGLTVLN